MLTFLLYLLCRASKTKLDKIMKEFDEEVRCIFLCFFPFSMHGHVFKVFELCFLSFPSVM